MAGKKKVSKRVMRSSVGKAKIKKAMGDWKAGEMHSGSKTGPVVKSHRQALAIALQSARKAVGKKSRKGSR